MRQTVEQPEYNYAISFSSLVSLFLLNELKRELGANWKTSRTVPLASRLQIINYYSLLSHCKCVTYLAFKCE